MGKITKIEVQKKNKKRCNIYIDGEYSFSVGNELIYKQKLAINTIVDESKLLEISKEDNYLKCKETALRIIERSYKTEKEMKDKLIEKGYEEEEINKTILFLNEYKFIDNKAYAKMYVNDRLKSQGNNKIKYALQRKGIEDYIIEEVISEINNDEQEEVAMEIGRKKYKQIIKKEKDKYKIKNKLCVFLVGRGYDYSLAKKVVDNVMNEE